MLNENETQQPPLLLNAFRLYYQRLEQSMNEIASRTDMIVVAQLGDDLDEFTSLVVQVSY